MRDTPRRSLTAYAMISHGESDNKAFPTKGAGLPQRIAKDELVLGDEPCLGVMTGSEHAFSEREDKGILLSPWARLLLGRAYGKDGAALFDGCVPPGREGRQ